MKIINKIATVFFVLFGMLSAFAQGPPGPGDEDPGTPNPPVPIDGVGLLILILAAILLGIYVIYRCKLKAKASV